MASDKIGNISATYPNLTSRFIQFPNIPHIPNIRSCLDYPDRYGKERKCLTRPILIESLMSYRCLLEFNKGTVLVLLTKPFPSLSIKRCRAS